MANETQMEALLAMANLEVQLLTLRQQAKALPDRLREVKAPLKQARNELSQIQQPANKLKHEIKERQAALVLTRETIDKFEGQMERVNSQREYLAGRKQVEEAIKINRQLQQELTEREEKLAVLQPDMNRLTEALTLAQEHWSAEESSVRVEYTDLNEGMKQIHTSLEKYLSHLPSYLKSHYQRLHTSERNPALTTGLGGNCGGCHMALPPQDFNRLRAEHAKLITCPHCHRILFYPPQLDEPEVDEGTASLEPSPSISNASPA